LSHKLDVGEQRSLASDYTLTTDIQTDTIEIIYHATSRVVKTGVSASEIPKRFPQSEPAQITFTNLSYLTVFEKLYIVS